MSASARAAAISLSRQQLPTRCTCPGNERPRFKHALIGLEKAFNSEDADHIGRQLVALMQKELRGCIKQRKLAACFVKQRPDELKIVLFLDDEPMCLRLKTTEYELDDDPCADTVATMKATIGQLYKDSQ